MKQEDEKTLWRKKANKNSIVSDFIFGAEIILLLLGYPSIYYHLYLLLTEFESRASNYGPRFFFHFNLGRLWEDEGPDLKRNKLGAVTSSTDRENKVSKTLSIWSISKAQHKVKQSVF